MEEPLRFVRMGPSTYDVFAGDVQLGWLDDHTIALLGYDTPDAARCAGTIAYAVVGWHSLPGHDGRERARWRDPNSIAPGHRIEVDGAIVGRVVRAPSHGSATERYGFELIRAHGQTFATGVHQFHRLRATALMPRNPPHAHDSPGPPAASARR